MCECNDTKCEITTKNTTEGVPVAGTSKIDITSNPTEKDNLAANAPASPLAEMFKNASREVKKLVLQTPSCEQTLGSPTSSTPSATSPSASTDKTDNHDFVLCPDGPDMRREEERLKTFDKWPVPFLSPENLARNGFYYLGRNDEVRCAFCKVDIMQWVEGDDPAKDHQRWAPQCPFLRSLAAGNVSYDSPAVGRDECGTRAPNSVNTVRMPGPANPRYATLSARLRSFKDWPRSLPQKPEDLADAGFFYTSQGDKTKCFYCDGGLKDWESDDIPWEQHARWFGRCAYVQLVKGPDFVQRVITEACALPGPGKEEDQPEEKPEPVLTPATELEKNDKSLEDDTKLCKICYAEERNVCFVPCGHVVACAKCALSTDKCPMCRRTFHNAVRLYFS